MIGVIDYGSGNFTSVYNALLTLSPNIKTLNKPADFEGTTHIILPGVGAFASAMMKLSELDLVDALEQQVLKLKKPYLGICVGMQILGINGFEFGRHKGLGWINSDVELLTNSVLPHIGWNEVEDCHNIDIFNGIKDKSTFYFVHSYAMLESPKDSATKVVLTEYGGKFICAVQKENIYGVQFHPEKSQDYGLKLLKNFINL